MLGRTLNLNQPTLQLFTLTGRSLVRSSIGAGSKIAWTVQRSNMGSGNAGDKRNQAPVQAQVRYFTVRAQERNKDNSHQKDDQHTSGQLRMDTPSYQLTFTCKKCDTRSSHNVTKQAYHKGTVLIQCPSCKNRHLIADHLKIFSDRKVTLEDILASKGESIVKGSLDLGDVQSQDLEWEELPPQLQGKK